MNGKFLMNDSGGVGEIFISFIVISASPSTHRPHNLCSLNKNTPGPRRRQQDYLLFISPRNKHVSFDEDARRSDSAAEWQYQSCFPLVHRGNSRRKRTLKRICLKNASLKYFRRINSKRSSCLDICEKFVISRWKCLEKLNKLWDSSVIKINTFYSLTSCGQLTSKLRSLTCEFIFLWKILRIASAEAYGCLTLYGCLLLLLRIENAESASDGLLSSRNGRPARTELKISRWMSEANDWGWVWWGFQCWGVWASDLETLFGVSHDIGCGLFFVGAAAWCKDGKSVDKKIKN